MPTKTNLMKVLIKRLLVIACIFLTSINLMADDFWIKQNFPDSVSILQIRINQNDELFVGAIYHDSVPWGYGRILRSFNYAATWEDITPFYYFPEIHDILIDPDGVLFLGTWYGGIFRSYDNGNSFEAVNDGLSNTVPTLLARQSDGTIYAGQFWGGGVDFSENDGGQWYPTNFPMAGINGLGIDNNNAIYVGSNGLFYSDDNGLTWSEKNNGFSSIAMLNHKCFAFTENAEVFTGTADGIYFSENNGEEWVNCLNSQSVYYIQIFNDEIFAGTYEDGVYYSDDGGNSWSQKNDGLDWFAVYSFAVDSENFIWCNTPEGIYRSTEDLVSVGSVSQNHKDICIYPNPCGSTLNLLLPNENFQNVKLALFDVSGKLVLQFNKKMTEFVSGYISIDVGNLESGIYLVSITVDGQIVRTKKLVIR